MGRRIGAWIIDFVFAAILGFVAFNVAVEGYFDIPGNVCAPGATEGSSADPLEPDELVCSKEIEGTNGLVMYDEASKTSVFLSWSAFWAGLGVFVGYGLVSFVIVEGTTGGSVGKLMTGLRVTTIEGRRGGIGRSLLRFVLWIVDALPYCFPLAGLIAGASTKGHRRVGDMAAGTYVVDKKYGGHALTIPGLNGPAMAPYVPPPTGYPGRYPASPTVPTTSGGWAEPSGSPRGVLIAPETNEAPATGAIVDDVPVHSTTPIWDADRNTYIQWDEFRSAWLQWDAAANEWRPIDEA